MILEICANSLQSAINAEQGGANRIELCTNLQVGGTTPSKVLIQSVIKALAIPVYVLIRPRGGDFIYTQDELEQMRSDISFCLEAGCKGVVFGALNREGTIDESATSFLMKAAKFMDVTFHRAFDLLDDHLEGLNILKELGVQRILTSGCNGTALQGYEMLNELVDESEEEVIIMPGGGIRPENIKQLLKTGAIEYHSAAMPANSHVTNSKMVKELAEVIGSARI
jgi:copper homeostasis protein